MEYFIHHTHIVAQLIDIPIQFNFLHLCARSFPANSTGSELIT
jgi:hypothetical protein